MTFIHLADAFIQSDLQCIQAIHLLSNRFSINIYALKRCEVFESKWRCFWSCREMYCNIKHTHSYCMTVIDSFVSVSVLFPRRSSRRSISDFTWSINDLLLQDFHWLLLESCQSKSVSVLRWSSHHIRKPVWGYLWIHLLIYWLDEVFSHFCWDLVGFLMSISVFNGALVSVWLVDQQHTSTHWCPRTSLSTSPAPQAFLYWLKWIILSLILFPRFSRSRESVAPWEVLSYSTEMETFQHGRSQYWPKTCFAAAFIWTCNIHNIHSCIVKNSAFTLVNMTFIITWKLQVSYPERASL